MIGVEKMKLVHTAELEDHIVEEFFEDKWIDLPDKHSLKQYGKFVEYQNEYKAFFALAPVQEQGYWLKSLYIKEGAPPSFPLAIIEASISLAKEQGGQDLFIYSHQQSLSSLLSLMQFKHQQAPAFAEGTQLTQGTWWKVDVTKVPQPK